MLKTNEEFIEQEVAMAVKNLQQYVKPGNWFEEIAPVIITSCCLKVLGHNEKLLQRLAELNKE